GIASPPEGDLGKEAIGERRSGAGVDSIRYHDQVGFQSGGIADGLFEANVCPQLRRPIGQDLQESQAREGGEAVPGRAGDLARPANLEIRPVAELGLDRKSTRVNSSHVKSSYAVF